MRIFSRFLCLPTRPSAGTEADFEFWKTLTLPFARRHAKGTDRCRLHSSSRSLFSCSSYLLKVSNNFTLKCNLSRDAMTAKQRSRIKGGRERESRTERAAETKGGAVERKNTASKLIIGFYGPVSARHFFSLARTRIFPRSSFLPLPPLRVALKPEKRKRAEQSAPLPSFIVPSSA